MFLKNITYKKTKPRQTNSQTTTHTTHCDVCSIYVTTAKTAQDTSDPQNEKVAKQQRTQAKSSSVGTSTGRFPIVNNAFPPIKNRKKSYNSNVKMFLLLKNKLLEKKKDSIKAISTIQLEKLFHKNLNSLDNLISNSE